MQDRPNRFRNWEERPSHIEEGIRGETEGAAITVRECGNVSGPLNGRRRAHTVFPDSQRRDEKRRQFTNYFLTTVRECLGCAALPRDYDNVDYSPICCCWLFFPEVGGEYKRCPFRRKKDGLEEDGNLTWRFVIFVVGKSAPKPPKHLLSGAQEKEKPSLWRVSKRCFFLFPSQFFATTKV